MLSEFEILVFLENIETLEEEITLISLCLFQEYVPTNSLYGFWLLDSLDIRNP